MKRQHKYLVLISLIILLPQIFGCAFKVPAPNVNPSKDMREAFPTTNKIHIKVGLYVDDDTRKYIYKQQKMGMLFVMTAGEYLYSISKEMGLQMFDEVVYVNSLPPYDESYRPDVEAVVKPEFLYCYGNAVGELSGHITAKVTFQVSAYNLDGEIVWKRKATGTKQSEEINFVSSFVGGLEDIGTIGYQAAFSAAVKIINDFYASPPEQLISLLETKKYPNKNYSGENSTLQELFFEKGYASFTKQRYRQAIHYFRRANDYIKFDATTSYFLGVCYAKTGDRTNALKHLNTVTSKAPNSSEAGPANQWKEKLKDTPKVYIVFQDNHNDNDIAAYKQLLINNLKMNSVFEIVDVTNYAPKNDDITSSKFKEFLANDLKSQRSRGNNAAKAVIYLSGNYSLLPAIPREEVGNTANKLDMNIKINVYSVKKRDFIGTAKIAEEDIIITGANLSKIINDNLFRVSKMLQQHLTSVLI